MALRDQLRPPENFSRLPLSNWSELDEQAIADVSPGLASPQSAQFLLRHLQRANESRELEANYLRHIARYLPESEIGALAEYSRKKFDDDIGFPIDPV